MSQAMPRNHPFRLDHRQRGQSTVEFVVLALVMVPLLLIVPLLGKHMDIAQAAAVASRYVAFEGSVRHSSSHGSWKSDAELAQEVRRRFFSNSDAFIKTHDTAGDFTAHRNTLWHDHRGQSLLTKFDESVGVTTTKEAMTQPSALFAGNFNLSYANLYSGSVTVKIADIADLKPFDGIGLSVSRSTTLLADPWAASGPGAVQSKIRGSGSAFPYAYLDGWATLLAPGIRALEFGDPPPDVGRVDPDVVPEGRLGP
jgi:hypothetical protein